MLRALTLSLGLALALLAPTTHVRATPRSERAVLEALERMLRNEQRTRATVELGRALQRIPTPTLARRYAELALPCHAPRSEPERKRMDRGARLLLQVLEERASEGHTWPEALGPYSAWALALRGDLDDGLTLLSRTGAHEPEQAARCLRAIATLALRARTPQLAEQALVLARTFAPSDRLLSRELGLLWLSRGDVAHALPSLAEAFALDPGELSARRDYAYALSAAGRPDEAFEVLKLALEACRAADVCLLELSRFALEANRLPDALGHVNAYLKQHPDMTGALFLLADIHLARSDRATARAVYQRILQLAPDNLRARAAITGLDAR